MPFDFSAGDGLAHDAPGQAGTGRLAQSAQISDTES